MSPRPAVSAAVVAGCVALAAVMMARAVVGGADDIFLPDLQVGYVAAAAACMLAFLVVYAVCWWLTLCALERRTVRFGATVRLFLLSWPGRYVPASLPYYGGRLALAPSAGLSRSAVAASLVYENLFAIAVSGGLALVLLAVGYGGRFELQRWTLAACAAALVSLLSLQPSVLRRLVRVGSRYVKRLSAAESHVLGTRDVLRLAAGYAGGTVLSGLAFHFGLRAVGEDAPLALSVAAYNLAGVAGMLAIAVPGGIGVRESVTVAIMASVVPPHAALSAAVLVRVVAVLTDIVPFAIIIAVAALQKIVTARRPGDVRTSRERMRAG